MYVNGTGVMVGVGVYRTKRQKRRKKEESEKKKGFGTIHFP